MGYRASSTNPDHWSTFEFASKTVGRPAFADGIGFVFTADDPYCGVDLDHVWQSDADEGADWALQILDRFNDTYSEISPSGQGVKIWCRANSPRCGQWPVGAGAIEIYDRARFFTMTGQSAGALVIVDHQSDIDALIGNLDEGRNQPQARTIPEVISQGQRHKALVSLAGSMTAHANLETSAGQSRREAGGAHDADGSRRSTRVADHLRKEFQMLHPCNIWTQHAEAV
jgi:primase-polymerase (primpol)-like protein